MINPKCKIIAENKLIAKIGQGTPLSTISDYEKLKNKPHINGIELIGDKTTEDLLLQRIMRRITNEEIEDMFKSKGEQ